MNRFSLKMESAKRRLDLNANSGSFALIHDSSSRLTRFNIRQLYTPEKGARLSFDPSMDVALEDLNPQCLRKYLSAYDPRFVQYFTSHGGLG